MKLLRLRKFALLAAAYALSCGSAGAVVLDWDSNTWTNANNGSPIPNNYDVDGIVGTDLTISFSGQTSKLRSDPTSGENTPAVLSTLQGGLAPLPSGALEKSLHIYASVGTQTEITIGVSFSATYTQGVENVSFTIFDIDKTTDAEFIKNIHGIALDGTLIPATITGLGSSVGLTGTGLNQLLTGNAPAADSGAGSGNGTATISFGANVIRGFNFTFDNSQGPPRVQEIALHDINFTPVPDINPALGGALSCIAATALMLFHRARVRARRE